MKKNYKNINFNIIFIFIVIIGFFLRYFNNFDQIFWNDENYTLFITEPSTSLKEFLNRHKTLDESPVIYFYILKLYNNVFYSSEFLRFSSIIFSTLTILVSYKYFKFFFEKKESLFCVFLIALNIFLIWQSKEARIASSVIFFGLINILIFYKYLLKDNFKNRLSLFLINLFSLSYYPFLLMLILSQFFYILFSKRSKLKIYIIILIITCVFYVLLNFDYILLKVSKPSHHFPLEISFFINYFFRSFFGSIIFGALNLIIFSFGLIYVLKNHRENFIIFNIYIILVSYVFAISFSLFKGGGVIAPRYFIFLIPSIIVIIVNFLSLKKLRDLKFLYLLFTILNTFFLYNEWKIQKPKVSFLLENLDTNITKNYFVDEGGMRGYEDIYNYYFKNSFLINKNMNYVEENFVNKYDKIYFICLNHAEMHVGLDKTIQRPDKCNKKLEDFSIISQNEIKDFKLILFKKNNN